MDDLDKLIITTALRDMFTRGSFSICTIDEILKMTGAVPDKQAYQRLRLLHCVSYSQMPQGVLKELPPMISAVLGGPVFDMQFQQEPSADFVKKGGLLSFFKR